MAAGWADVDPPWEALFDLWLDPSEGFNRIGDPSLTSVVEDLRRRLHDWMVRTDDPLLNGPVPPADGTVLNTVDQVSASRSHDATVGTEPDPLTTGSERLSNVRLKW